VGGNDPLHPEVRAGESPTSEADFLFHASSLRDRNYHISEANQVTLAVAGADGDFGIPLPLF